MSFGGLVFLISFLAFLSVIAYRRYKESLPTNLSGGWEDLWRRRMR